MATNLYVVSPRKSSPDLDPRSRHIDEWQRISEDYRNKKLGQDWYDQIEALYELIDEGGPLPSFRPLVRVPELQMLMLREANDLSEVSPQVYVMNAKEGKRDKDRESSFQSQWREAHVNYHSMFVQLMSLYSGMATLQIQYDPDARNGRGGMVAKARDPRSFHCDPTTDYTCNWAYTIANDYMHYEEIRAKWPLTSRGIRPRIQGRAQSPALTEAGYGFQMPEGPMSMMPGLGPQSRSIPSDTRLRVRTVHCNDYTRLKVEEKDLPDGAITIPDLQWKYPNGRMLVDCEGQILQDGDNPYPLRMFPHVPFWSMPPLYGILGFPAIRFSRDLQNVSERLYTQLFENAVRLNNGVWFIDERTGIDPNLFGGMPGEVQVKNAGSPDPTCVFPGQMPAHFTQLPQLLLDKQKFLHGFTEAREGKPGAGNISPELQDAAVERAQGLTQLRARLAAISYERAAILFFYTMGRYFKRQHLPLRGRGDVSMVEWQGILRPDEYDVLLDDDIRVLSQTQIRRLVPDLIKAAGMPLKAGLEHIGFPDAAEIAKERDNELALQALGRISGGGKGKK